MVFLLIFNDKEEVFNKTGKKQYILTPEEADNCTQLSSQRWAEKTGGEWSDKPISMLYRKNK